MKRRERRLLIAAAVLVALFAIYILLRPRPIDSLSGAAVELLRKDYPRTFVLLPPSGAPALGRTPDVPVTRDVERSARLTTRAEPCFLVKEKTRPAGGPIQISYRSSQTIKEEFSDVLAQVGLGAKDDATATLVLDDLKLREGVGVPDLNGPCNFAEPAAEGQEVSTHTVVTKEFVVGTALFVFGTASAADLHAKAGPLTAHASWQRAGEGLMGGRDLAIFGVVDTVQTTVTRLAPQDLGTIPKSYRGVISLPKGFEGSISVIHFAGDRGELTLAVNSQLGTPAASPTNAETCQLGGQGTVLTRGVPCRFWFTSNALLSVQWRYGSEDHVLLDLKGYKTTFE